MAAKVEADHAEARQRWIGELLIPAQPALTQAMDEQDLRCMCVALRLAHQGRAIGRPDGERFARSVRFIGRPGALIRLTGVRRACLTPGVCRSDIRSQGNETNRASQKFTS